MKARDKRETCWRQKTGCTGAEEPKQDVFAVGFVGRMSHFAVSSTRRLRRMAQSTWPERYAAHEQAMLNDPEKRRLWDEYASRPEAVAEMPSGLFGQTSPIPEEKKVGVRRSTC
jgi:hypothetical protein